MIAIVTAILASVAAGVWAERRFAASANEASRRALLLVLYVVLPPAVFFNVAAAEVDVEAGTGVALAWAALTLAAGLAWIVSTRLLGLARPAVGSVIVCVLIANTGYLGYPVVAALEGFDALSIAVVFDVLVGAPVFLLGAFSVGAAFGDRAGEGIGERLRAFLVRSPPLYAALLGLLAPGFLVPEIAVDASRIAIVAILPLGFFAVGTALAAESEQGTIAAVPRFDPPVALAVFARMALAPLLLLALAAPLIELPQTYLLLIAMPCGINTMIVTHAYGLDQRVSAAAIAWSTALAVAVLVPLSFVV